MKNFVVAAFVAAIAGSASAGQVTMRFTPYQTGQGGEFRVTDISGYAGYTGLFSDVASNTFQTFCIEYTEHVSNNQIYNYEVQPNAIGGGAGGQVGNTGDPVSNATGWLYASFRRGTLPAIAYTYNSNNYSFNYHYSNSNSNNDRKATASILQSAIWLLENEPDANSQTGQNAAARDALVAAALLHQNDADYKVRALNLFFDNNGNNVYDQGDDLAQSMLTLIPLPTGSGLAIAGLGALAIRRRRTA